MADEIDRGIHTTTTDKQGLINTLQSMNGALAFVEQMKGGFASRASLPEIETIVDGLLRGLPHFGYTPPETFSVCRGRLDNEVDVFLKPSDFSYRPLDDVNDFGRCHQPGTNVFYGAINLVTLMSEMRPKAGDRLHFAIARKKASQPFTLTEVGGLDYCRRYGRSMLGEAAGYQLFNQWLSEQEIDQYLRASVVDAYFADVFSTPVNNSRDYGVTSTISSLLFDAKDANENPLLDGFAYPSVAHRGGLNFAIKPSSFDSAMEWVQFKVIEIGYTVGYGIYAYSDEMIATEIDESGNLIWNEAE